MSMLDEILAKREELYAIARKHQAEKLWVFGSVARREERPDSDVDFLVKFGPEYSWHGECQMKDDLERLFRRDIDVVHNTAVLNPANARFASVVCREAVAI